VNECPHPASAQAAASSGACASRLQHELLHRPGTNRGDQRAWGFLPCHSQDRGQVSAGVTSPSSSHVRNCRGFVNSDLVHIDDPHLKAWSFLSTGDPPMKLSTFVAALAVNMIVITVAIALEPSLPAYQATSGLSGQIKSVGSDTLGNEVTLWAKGFKELYPNVKIDVEAEGSLTAPPALLEGASQFGPMSIPMTAEEVDAFVKKYGYRPSSFRVAVDALAIYVNKDNPISCLTLQQLDQMFSSTRKGSAGRNINTWGDVGLTGEWATKPISLYGRNSVSGTYEFFREMVLYKGAYKGVVRQQPGSEEVVKEVGSDKFAIGYSGIGFKTDNVRTVGLASFAGGQCYDPSAEATFSGRYPLARYLRIYLNKKPDQPLDPVRSEFIKYILSRDGQEQTEKGGFYAITNDMREDELKKLGISTAAK
jgi:phosphate transport system substrate-binding protein